MYFVIDHQIGSFFYGPAQKTWPRIAIEKSVFLTQQPKMCCRLLARGIWCK
jgi:hypothetical protein